MLLGGVLTRHEAAKRGYEVEDVCELCGERGDHVFHRTFKCEGTKRAVMAAVPPWFWAEAQRASATDLFWSTAVVPHPGDMVPPARSDYLSWVHDADGTRGDDPFMHGDIFIDGSCSTSVFRGLQRAAMAIVNLGTDARPKKVVSVPIWNTLPQTSQSAEFAAFAGVSQVIDGDSIVHGDCRGVLDLAACGVPPRFDGRRKYAGVLLSMQKCPAGLARITSTVKVKAHQNIDAIVDERQRRLAIGNNLADAAAKAARARHPQPSEEVQSLIAYWEKRAPLVVQAVATAMPMFSPLGGKLGRRPKAVRPCDQRAERELPPMHAWEYTAGRWRCGQCWTYIVGDGPVPAHRRREVCQRARVSARNAQFEARGHLMLCTDGDLPISFCARCGGWSSRRANRLCKPCGPPTAAGAMALKRLNEGKHPWQARDGNTGKGLPRGRLLVRRGQCGAMAAGFGRGQVATSGAEGDLNGMTRRPEGHEADTSTAKRRRTQAAPASPSTIVDLTAEHPPSEAMHLDQDYHDSEEDAFGHGGALDQPLFGSSNEGKRPRSPRADDPRDGSRMKVTVSDPNHSMSASSRLKGTSMPMLISTLRNTPSRFGPEHVVPTFNAEKGKIVRATLGDIQAEVERLRASGVSDEGKLASPAEQMVARADVGREPAAVPSTQGDDTTKGTAEVACEVVKYANRAELLRHLAQGAAVGASASMAPAPATERPLRGHMLPQAGAKRKACGESGIERGDAVASSTYNSAVGTRAGPRGSLA